MDYGCRQSGTGRSSSAHTMGPRLRLSVLFENSRLYHTFINCCPRRVSRIQYFWKQADVSRTHLKYFLVTYLSLWHSTIFCTFLTNHCWSSEEQLLAADHTYYTDWTHNWPHTRAHMFLPLGNFYIQIKKYTAVKN